MSEDLTEQYALVVQQANSLIIQSDADYEKMAGFVLTLKAGVKYFEDLYRPRIREATAVVDHLRDDMRGLQAPANNAIAYGSGELTRYRREQEDIKRKAAIAEAAAKKKADEEKRMQLAELAEMAGEPALANEIISAPADDPIVMPEPAAPKVEGLSFRTDWKWQLVDAKKIPCEYHKIDDVKINGVVRALKETTNIPGIRVYSEQSPVGRTK